MIDLDEALLALITLRGVAVAEYEGDGIYIGDLEAGSVVLPDGEDTFRVMRHHRGVLGPPRVSGATKQVLEHYLALEQGGIWRLTQEWRPLKPGGPAESLPPGVDVTEQDESGVTLRVPGERPTRLHGVTARLAHRVAWAVVTPLDDLIASMRDPRGRPAFPLDDAAPGPR